MKGHNMSSFLSRPVCSRFCIVCLLLFGALSQVDSARARQSNLGLDEVEISSLGAVRLSEMLRLMPGMEAWSNDRYTQRLLGYGLGGLHGEGPSILIDGVSYPAFFMDRTLTESLPVSPSDLSSVQWEPGRRLIAGGRMADGVLRLTTRPVEGWVARASIGLINETGDPGPAKLLDSTATNVDRSGPAIDARLAWGNGTWTMIAGLQTDLHHLTDERISGRVRRVYAAPVQPVITQFSPHIRLSRHSSSSVLDMAVGSSRRKGMLFYESAGWEWPLQTSRDWGRAHLNHRLAQRWQVGIEAEGQRITTTNRAAFIELPSSLTLLEVSTEGWVRMGTQAKSLTLGVGYRAHQFEQHQDSISKNGLFGRIEGNVIRSSTTSSFSVLARQTSRVQSESSTFDWAATTSFSLTADSGRKLALEASWLSGRFKESGAFMELVSMGFDPAEWISTIAVLPPPSREQEIGVSLHGSLPLSESVTAWARLDGRWMSGWNLIDRIVEQPFGIGPLLPTTAFSTDRQGWLFSRSIGLDRMSMNGPRVRVVYQFMHVSSMGDDVFFRHTTGFPRHRIMSMISEKREGGLSWNIRAGLASPWTWPEYKAPARKDIPVEVVLDATVGKDLVGGRMKTLVSFLNLPDATLGHHPAGVIEQFAVRLTLSLRLESQ